MAGFFGLFDYSKPGKGVDKEGPQKKRIFYFFELFFRKFWKIITINMIYILFCIPIVTIGPATVALQKVLRDFSNERPVFLFSDFFEAFKKNFKQGFVVGLLDAVLIFLLGVSIYFYYQQTLLDKTFFYVPLCISICAGFVIMLMNFYIFLMISTLDMKLFPMIKNAFYLAILGIKTNLLTLVFTAAITIGISFLNILIAMLIGIVIFFALYNFIVVFNSYQYIEKFVISPYYEKTGERRPDVYYSDEEDAFDESVFEDIGTLEKPAISQSVKHSKTIK